MVLSIETQQLANFDSLRREGTLRGSGDRPSSTRNHSAAATDTSQSGDIVDLSRRVFETLAAGIQDLKQADLDLASQRLEATQELLESTRLLLEQAGREQRDIILNNISAIGQSLDGIGSQIEQIFGGAETAGAIAYRETLSVEYSFTSTVVTEASLNITQTEDGLEIEQAIKQTQSIVASLKIERTQTLAVNDSPAVPQLLNVGQQFEDILSSFRNTLQNFQAELRNLLETFTEEEIQPEVPVDLLNKFLSSVLDITEDAAA